MAVDGLDSASHWLPLRARLCQAMDQDETSGWTLSFRDVSTARAGDIGLTEIRAAINDHVDLICAVAEMLGGDYRRAFR